MPFGQRYVEKFEDAAASISYSFPLYGYEWDNDGSFRAALESAAGADYAHDFGGQSPSPVNPVQETVRFEVGGVASPTALETALDEMQSELRRIGLGKLFTVDDAGTRRWAWARLAKRPHVPVRVQNWMRQQVSIEFLRISDWFAASQTTGSQAISASPTTVVINNPGNLPVVFMVFRLRASASGGITNPSLTNTENGYSIATTRDSASADDEVRIDTEAGTVEYSDDDGATYADDYSLVTLGALQAGLFKLDPGANDVEVVCGGTPAFTLEWAFYAPYA